MDSMLLTRQNPLSMIYQTRFSATVWQIFQVKVEHFRWNFVEYHRNRAICPPMFCDQQKRRKKKNMCQNHFVFAFVSNFLLLLHYSTQKSFARSSMKLQWLWWWNWQRCKAIEELTNYETRSRCEEKQREGYWENTGLQIWATRQWRWFR